jgi:hypothetical protein
MERRGFFGRMLGGFALAVGVKPTATVPTTYRVNPVWYHDRLWASEAGDPEGLSNGIVGLVDDGTELTTLYGQEISRVMAKRVDRMFVGTHGTGRTGRVR